MRNYFPQLLPIISLDIDTLLFDFSRTQRTPSLTLSSPAAGKNRRHQHMTKKSRRDFLKTVTISGAALFSFPGSARGTEPPETQSDTLTSTDVTMPPPRHVLDLAPGQWIWYPSGRTLPNTFVLFRKTVLLASPVKRAVGWIAADSRYLLTVNGRRIQWGPAPADPRCMEVDPLDLTNGFQTGENIIGVTVLHYGHGDGTWPIGKPGFIFILEIELQDGTRQVVVSDTSWKTLLPRSWQPGHYKRWYLRALQEEFDARAHPYGWDTSGFLPPDEWLPAMTLDCPPDKPPICSTYTDYLMETRGDRETSYLQPRSIPLLQELMVPVARLAESCWILWKRPPQEYFAVVTPDAFSVERVPCCTEDSQGRWTVALDGVRGAALTFEFEEGIVGFPYFTIEAAPGTVIELMVQEAHRIGGPALLNTFFHSWARFVCKDGINNFETFDFEGCRWMQLHIHGPRGTVVVSNAGVRRRLYRWPNRPQVRCTEPELQRLLDASLNTLRNSAQETAVDGMGRERQQYSGDGAHQLHGAYLAFGEHRLPARFISTFSKGLSLDGYFLDCWPAYDRLARVMERQVGLTIWGPLVDHGVGFVFDCFHHYLYTGNLDDVYETYPRLQRFVGYLKSIQTKEGILPVENLGVPNVWIDHDAYKRNHQHHKQCAFNLYAAAMLNHAFAPLCRAFGDTERENAAKTFAQEILNATISKFWSQERGLFVANLPWIPSEKETRLCDRSLATSVLFDQCPGGRTGEAVNVLASLPSEMGLSYPANAGWRLWALAKGGRTDVVMKELRERWARMDSVLLNNTIQEAWIAQPDSGDLWSHCAIVPLYIMYMSIAGIQPSAPGFSRCRIRPQLADLEGLDLVVPTVRGELSFHAGGKTGDRIITISLPRDCEGELVLDKREKPDLPRISDELWHGNYRYRMGAGTETTVKLKYS